MPNGAFNICCPRDCVSRHNGGTSGAPLKPPRVDSALKALSTLRGLRGAPEVPPLCRETQSLGQQMLNAPFGIDGLSISNPAVKFAMLGRSLLLRVPYVCIRFEALVFPLLVSLFLYPFQSFIK